MIAVWLPLTKFPTLDLIKSFAEIGGSESATETREEREGITTAKPISRRTPPAIKTAIPRLIQNRSWTFFLRLLGLTILINYMISNENITGGDIS